MGVLSLEVCKACRLERGLPWSEVNDLLWGPWRMEDGSVLPGRVLCPHGKSVFQSCRLMGKGSVDILCVDIGFVDVELPQLCRYRMEHVVLGEAYGEYMRREPVPIRELYASGLGLAWFNARTV